MTIFHRFQNILRVATSIFNDYTKPNPKYCKDKIQYEVDHKRNKAIALVQLLGLSVFVVNLIIGNGPLNSNIQGLIGGIAMLTILCISCHFHPEVFKVIFNVYVLSFGFGLAFDSRTGIYGAWIAVPIFPIIVYLFTGSISHFIINAICQTVFQNTFYQKYMENALTYSTVEESLQALTYYSHQNIVYIIFFTVFTHFEIQNAFYQLKISEKQKDNFEKQKNFLLGFSHELRNLINSLMGNVKLASLEKLTEKAKDLLLNAEVCSELLLHLVNNILDTGKVEIGELEINSVPTRIYDTMERIWSICSELMKRKNLKGRMKINKNIPKILTLDHYRLTQIFLNLIGNAVKYTDTGYIDISVDWISDQEVVNDKCFEPIPFNDSDDHEEGIFEKNQALSILNDNYIILGFSNKKIDKRTLNPTTNINIGILKISVSDTGCGIQSENIDKLFQKFTQVTTDANKRKLGTGLGLFITKQLCQRMNGQVKVFSKIDKGSTFALCLPAEPATGSTGFLFDLGPPERPIPHQRLKAMVVDDEYFGQAILKDFLGKLHIEVIEIAQNGLIAYEKFSARQRRNDYINIVTMDLNMPVLDGKLSAQKIREYEVEKHLNPCLMIIASANCSESEIKECLDKDGMIRADAFLKKPVTIDELSRVIASHFAQSHRNL